MSFPEDEPTSGVHPLRQTKAYAFLMPALFFAAMGAGVWYLSLGLWHLADQNSVSEPSPVLRPPPAPTPAPSAPSDGEPTPVPVEPEPVSESESSAISILPPEPGKKPKPVKEWRLRGHVYDLATLQPVAGCALVFVDAQENRRIETRSSPDGRYRVVVAPLADRGYSVSLSKRGYAPAYLNPGTEGVPEMSSERRLEISKELSATLSAAPYSVQAYDEQPLITDFYLAPRP